MVHRSEIEQLFREFLRGNMSYLNDILNGILPHRLGSDQQSMYIVSSLSFYTFPQWFVT